MCLNKLIIVLQIVNILTIKAISNKDSVITKHSKSLQTGTFYLNNERPLWILQDVMQQKINEKNSTKTKQNNFNPLNHHSRRKQQHSIAANKLSNRIDKNVKTKAQKRLGYGKNYKGVQLPHNYITSIKMTGRPNLVTSSRKYKNSKFIQNMPVFDAVPGDEAYSKTTPIFIYTGTKGRMLLNTMLSKSKYPMQEPVPGQVLYPPRNVLFKPRALVENLQKKLNVTMIPFYAYEAIDPRAQSQLITTTTTTTSSSSPASINHGKNFKTAKQYTAFYSPEEVISQPATYQYYYSIEHTTNVPLTLENPFENHRFNQNATTSTTSTTLTTTLPHKKFEVKYIDGDDKFQITYEEDDAPYLERPLNMETTTLAPVPYQSYTFDKNYYAFPVYTMAKLLKNNDDSAGKAESRTDGESATDTDTALNKENNKLQNKSSEDTWFILNSRYKGPLKRTNNNNLHSSKYTQTSPTKVQNDLDF